MDGASLPVIRTADPPRNVSSRIEALDLARGLALFGVLMANLPYFLSGPILSHDRVSFSGIDSVAYEAIGALFTGKLYPLLSFLFGYGAWLMFDRARRQGVSFAVVYERRLIGLALLGILHGVLLYDGDILFTYALLGFVLMAAVTISARAKVTLAAIVFVVQLLVHVFVEGFRAPVAPAWAHHYSVSYAHELALRAIGTAFEVPNLLITGWLVLAMFLVGAAAAERGWLQTPREHESLLRTLRGAVLLLGLLIGVPAGALSHSNSYLIVVQLANVLNTVAGPMVALGMAAWATRWSQTQRRCWLRNALAALGRVSLSAYLLQSLAMLVLLNSVGLGLASSLPLVAVVGLAIGLYVVQLATALWWTKRWRFGPAEWFLRSFTYGQAQAMRR